MKCHKFKLEKIFGKLICVRKDMGQKQIATIIVHAIEQSHSQFKLQIAISKAISYKYNSYIDLIWICFRASR